MMKLILIWIFLKTVSEKANQAATFSINDRKLYVPVLTLSTEDNAKLLKELKSGFKRAIIWNKYQSELAIERQNQYFEYT